MGNSGRHWVTQRDIADALGLEVTTVSKALRHHPNIAVRTRDRVLAQASAMGYVRDPMLSALARHREARRGHGYRATLAWIYNHGKNVPMDRFAGYGDYLAGARERAAILGYRIEEFWVGRAGVPAARLGTILEARGITGVVVAPQAGEEGALQLPWERLSAVTIGYTLREPALHMVSNDHYQTMTGLLELLRRRGFEQIGVYLHEEDNRRVQRRVAAAFLSWSAQRHIPLLVYAAPRKDAFLAWVRENGLDAVVTREVRVRGWLDRAGLRGAEGPFLASYALDGGRDADWAGMTHNNAAIGAAAIDWLARMVEHGETGLPTLPSRLLVPGTWREPDKAPGGEG